MGVVGIVGVSEGIVEKMLLIPGCSVENGSDDECIDESLKGL